MESLHLVITLSSLLNLFSQLKTSTEVPVSGDGTLEKISQSVSLSQRIRESESQKVRESGSQRVRESESQRVSRVIL